MSTTQTRRRRHTRGRRRGAISSRSAQASRSRLVPGAAPGTLANDPDAQDSTVRVFGYDGDDLAEVPGADLARIDEMRRRWSTVWVNVDGLGNTELIVAIGQRFGLHPLALEDVVNVHQRPKVETYGDHAFVVLRMPSLDGRLETEQLGLFFGEGFVVTFQERLGDCLEPVRERLRKGRGRIRGAAAGYLAYALIDAVVDHFFPIIEHYGEQVEALSDAVFRDPHESLIEQIHMLKRDFMLLRRAVFPLRETLAALQRDDMPHIVDDTRIYLRDCYDHVIQLMDLVESFREIASGLTEAYQSSVGFRTNEVMRVLTIFATIFIPLTFVAGIYGMNFDQDASRLNMPELRWAYGYPAFWGVMLLITGASLLYFRRKGWLGGGPRARGQARRRDGDEGGGR